MKPATPHRSKKQHALPWVLMLLAVSACTAGTSSSVLGFFWGPPEPLASEPVQPGSGWQYMTPEEREEFEVAKRSKAWVSWHKPYQELSCPECHKIAPRPKGAPGAGTKIKDAPELVMPIEQLCGKCHELPEKRYVHGPVASLSCELCHDPHKSRQPHLVKVKEVKELCINCHQGETFTTAKDHEAVADQSCTRCHDPHGSMRDWLQKPDAGTLKQVTDPAPAPDRGKAPVGDEAHK